MTACTNKRRPEGPQPQDNLQINPQKRSDSKGRTISTTEPTAAPEESNHKESLKKRKRLQQIKDAKKRKSHDNKWPIPLTKPSHPKQEFPPVDNKSEEQDQRKREFKNKITATLARHTTTGAQDRPRPSAQEKNPKAHQYTKPKDSLILKEHPPSPKPNWAKRQGHQIKKS